MRLGTSLVGVTDPGRAKVERGLARLGIDPGGGTGKSGNWTPEWNPLVGTSKTKLTE